MDTASAHRLTVVGSDWVDMNEAKDSNPLHISWHDSLWIPNLNQTNVLDYFSERTNPFYDRTCNNEIIKMQRLNPEQLNNMQGLEYILLHVQEPILYVIRKQHRHSPTQITVLADFYIIAGVVYQAPDLNSLINSRMQTTLYHLQNAFEEAHSYSRFHPSKGYWWEFKDNDKDAKDKQDKTGKDKVKEETNATIFQRKRVDILLNELAKKFPPPKPAQSAQPAINDKPNQATGATEPEGKMEKTEPSNQSVAVGSASANRSSGPPEKRARIN